MENAATQHSQPNSNYQFALVSLTSLFFMWGFITCLNDILIPHLKAVFDLSYTQSMLIQFCFFGAYFLVSIPSGELVKKLGYQKGIVIGLSIAALGCLLFYPSAELHSYPLFLAALFVLASGITLLQVSANPYVTLLGPQETAPSRLTMTQAFNSLGTTVAPYFGGLLILAAGTQQIGASQTAHSVQIPYLLLMAMLLALAAVFSYLKLPHIDAAEVDEGETLSGSAWQYRHLKLGALAIFLYVGAEVAIGSFIVIYFSEPAMGGLTEHDAATYLTYYWGGAMVGRFIGAAVMQKVQGGTVLAVHGVMASILLLTTVFSDGAIAMWSVLAIGLFNSIMFPTIFSLALAGLGKHTSQGSGILCLAIVGGAIVPLLQGITADAVGVKLAFLLPILCYLYISFYGLRGHKVS